MKRSKLFLALLSLASVAAMASCGSKPSSDSTASSSRAGSSETASSESASAPSSESKESESSSESKDYEAPTISLEQALQAYVGEEYAVPMPTYSDPVDAAEDLVLTYVVKDNHGADVAVTEGKFVPAEVGEYSIAYTVTNTHEKSATLDKTVAVVEHGAPSISSKTVSIGTKYVNEVMTLPSVSVSDESGQDCDLVVTLSLPDASEQVLTEWTYAPTVAGDYSLTYTATNPYGKSSALEYDFTVESEFVIGWDKRLYTTAVSGLTTLTMNHYLTYVKGQIGEQYQDCVFTLKGYDNEDATELVNAITADGCDVTVGFTASTIDADLVRYVKRKSGTIANATGKYIACHNENDLTSAFYDASITENGFASLQTSKIVVAWFRSSSAKAPDGLLTAVDEALEAFLSEKGYAIDVESKVFTKPSGTTYQQVKDQILESEAVFGINWGTNVASSSGFMLYKVRVADAEIQGNARKVIGMVKHNGTIYSFYDEIFDYLQSDEMAAIYAATY